MQYQINIDIDEAGLRSIYAAGQAVTFVKSVVSDPLGSGNLPIAWLAFQPFEVNQVSWIETYYLYATTTTLQAGATIVMTSQTGEPVQPGLIYTFSQGQFDNGVSGGAPDTYNLNNQSQVPNLDFGLAQSASVNNVQTFAPLNAVPVLFNEQASFTPEETLSIFLSSTTNNGSVLSQIASNALEVTLSSQNPVVNLGFNDASNTFYVVPPSSVFAGKLISARRAA